MIEDPAAEAVAGGLTASGVRPGDRVAALMADQAPAVALVDALLDVGAVHVPLDRRAADAELAERLAMVEPRWLVHDAVHARRAEALAAPAFARALAIEPLLTARAVPPKRRVGPDAPATIVFTSGTTGRPRAALLSQASQDASADAWAAALAPRTDDAWLLSLPLHHVAGLAIVRRARRWGIGLRIPRSLGAEGLVRALESGISHVSLVPTQLDDLLRAWGGDRAAPTTLRAVLVGGAAAPLTLLARARDAGFPILTTYGMTETSSGIAVGGAEPATLADPGTFRALPGVDLRIGVADASDSAGIGPIEIRGPMVFSGYLDDPSATAGQLRDGWFRSSDRGSLDQRGLLRVLGRRDEVFISGGEHVDPAEIEAVLRTLPGIMDAAVVGEHDARWGHVPLAAIVVAPGVHIEDDEVRRHGREHLAAYKVPKRIVRLDTLPRTDTGKLLRRELADLLEVADP